MNQHGPGAFGRLPFVTVPGGRMQMGILPTELDLLDFYLGHKPHIVAMLRPIIETSSPVCEIEVAPFLCSRLLRAEEILGYVPGAETDPLGAVPRLTALEVARAAGARLPSDAELEWLARQGGASPFVLDVVYEAPEDDPKNVLIVDQPTAPRFGISDLFEAQWAADDWFPSHEGRPRTAAARVGGDPQGVRRFEEFDFECVGKEAVIAQLSALRHPGKKWRARVRLVLDAPPEAG
jgi:hypothetical protein